MAAEPAGRRLPGAECIDPNSASSDSFSNAGAAQRREYTGLQPAAAAPATPPAHRAGLRTRRTGDDRRRRWQTWGASTRPARRWRRYSNAAGWRSSPMSGHWWSSRSPSGVLGGLRRYAGEPVLTLATSGAWQMRHADKPRRRRGLGQLALRLRGALQHRAGRRSTSPSISIAGSNLFRSGQAP